MGWARLHDGLNQNPKLLRLSDHAFRVWVAALVYCNQAQTNGLIPYEVLPQLGAPTPDDLAQLTTPLFVNREPLWSGVVGVGYLIHDYLDWNDSADVVAARRAKAHQRLVDWRTKRDMKRVSDDVSQRVSQRV